MHGLLLIATQIPGETTVNKALDSDPVVLALVLAGLIAVAMIVGAITVLLFVRIVGGRASAENKTVTTMAEALADALDTRENHIAKEIRAANEDDQKHKEAMTQQLVAQSKVLELAVGKLEALTVIVEPLNEMMRSVEVLRLSADKNRETLGIIVGQNTTLDDVVQGLRSELSALTSMLKETTGNISDIHTALSTIAMVVKQITEMNEIVHYLKEKADTQPVKTLDLSLSTVPPVQQELTPQVIP